MYPGIIHTYLAYDPKRFPSPTAPEGDMVSGAFEHLLAYGSMRELTEEELARAVRIDPSMIGGLGPSLDALIALLEQRKAKILATYETDTVLRDADAAYRDRAADMNPPPKLAKAFLRDVASGQLRDLERLWYRAGGERSQFARELLPLIERLGERYEVEELAAKYPFTGRTPLTVPEAIAVKEELEQLDKLLEQLREAAKTAQIGIIDMDALREFAEPGDLDNLASLRRQIEEYIEAMAQRQGLERTPEGYRLTPRAYRIFQRNLLNEIFEDLQAARSGRHQGPVVGEGPVELTRTRTYAFGDSVVHMDVAQTVINGMIRTGGELPLRLSPDDIEIHETRNSPRCATSVILDMSGSMRYGGMYVNAKRMGLALDGLIRSEYPGDYLQFIEMATFAKPRHVSELPALMPKPVTVYDPVVRLRADMSDTRITEMDVPPHFTNIQHALALSRTFLSSRDTPNRQVILITDGLPTAHFEAEQLYLLYPPDPRTEAETMREAQRCRREGITINIFLLPSWSQTREDVQFAQRMVEATSGRVFFTGGDDLDRFVVWDYVKSRRRIIG